MKLLDNLADILVGFMSATGKLFAAILAVIGCLVVIGIFGAEGVKALIGIAAIIIAWKLINKIWGKGS